MEESSPETSNEHAHPEQTSSTKPQSPILTPVELTSSAATNLKPEPTTQSAQNANSCSSNQDTLVSEGETTSSTLPRTIATSPRTTATLPKQAVDSSIVGEASPPQRSKAAKQFTENVTSDLNPGLDGISSKEELPFKPSPTKSEVARKTSDGPAQARKKSDDISASDTVESSNTRELSVDLLKIWKAVHCHKWSSLFRTPVSVEDAPGYDDTIYQRMDLTTLRQKLGEGAFRSSDEFFRDVMLMLQNAMVYNAHGSDVYEMASKLKRYVIELMVENFPESAFFVGYDVEAHSMPARKDKVNSETHALTTETDVRSRKRKLSVTTTPDEPEAKRRSTRSTQSKPNAATSRQTRTRGSSSAEKPLRKNRRRRS